MTIKERFDEAKTIVDVFKLQSLLKESGEFSLEEINYAATTRRKELSQSKTKFITPLKKHKPAATQMTKTTQFAIQPKHLNSGLIEFDGTTFYI